MIKKIAKNNFLNSSIKEDHQPELFEIIKYLFKQKKLYALLSSLSFIIGILFYAKSPKIWKGEFQIVIKEDEARVTRTFGLIKNPTSLMTNIKILKSPSTLEPVFNFVKEKKKGTKEIPKDIKSWIENFEISLLKDTSIINVSYFDQDPELIIPVLERVTNIFKNYTFTNKQENIDLGLKYLNSQLSIARQKADISLKEFQDFALTEGLGDFDGLQIKSDLDLKEKNFSSKDKLKDKELNPLQKTDPIKSPITDSIGKRYEEHKTKLTELEAEIIEKERIFKDESKVLTNLKLRRDTLKSALSRPKEVIIKFRELEKKATKYDALVNMLESKLTNQKLEKARTILPWKLISTPTIFENPISPRISKTIIPFIVAGFILATTIALVKKLINGKITDLNYLKNLINLPLIKTFSLDDKEKWEESINLILKEESLKKNIPILIDFTKNINIEDKFTQLIQLLERYKFKIETSLENSFESNEILVIIRSESITHKMIEDFEENAYIINNKLVGWILLKE